MFFMPLYKSHAIKAVLIFLISFALCLPYLFYTYSITGKLLYWTNSGSLSLYTMSTPYENEFGDWKSCPELLINPNHKVFIDSVLKLKPLEIDEALKAKAILHIKSHPQKYVSNWLTNIGRLLFSYPYSKTQQTIKTYFFLIPNMIIITLILLAFISSIVNYKIFPKEIMTLFLFMIIYLFGCTLISSYSRMFIITMPFWFIFILYVLDNTISIKIKLNKS